MGSVEKSCSLLFFFVSIYVCFESYRFNLGSFSRPDAGFLPFAGGALLGIVSLFTLYAIRIPLVKAIRETLQIIVHWRWRKSLLVSCTFFAYAVLLGTLGFILCTFLFVSSLYVIAEPRKLHIALATGVLATLFCYILFQILLKAPLPKGAFL